MIYAKPSTALLVVFRAYLASDHVTPATGKTIAITISKNGGAFGNPNAGATNATEISSGFYKVSLDTTDTGTAGPLAVRGAEAAIDDVGAIFYVGQSPADVTHIGGSAVTASGGIPAVNVTQISGQTATAAAPVTVPATIASTTNITAATGIDVTKIGGSNVTAASGIPEVKVQSIAANAITATSIASDAITAAKVADGTIDAATFAAGAIDAAAIAPNAIGASELAADAVTEIQSGLATASALSTLQTSVDTIDDFVDTEVAAIKAKTDSLTFTSAGKVDANVLMLNSVSASALNLEKSASVIQRGTVDAGSFSTTTTEFESDDVTTAAADHWNGRIVIFTSGTLTGQASVITDYAKVGSNGHFTIDATTSIPADNVTFVII